MYVTTSHWAPFVIFLVIVARQTLAAPMGPPPPDTASSDQPNPSGGFSTPPPTDPKFDPGQWEAAGSLDEGRMLSTIVFGNKSLFVVGGCLNSDCSRRSSVMTQYNPITQLVERSTELHRGIAGMRSSVTLEGGVANGIYLCHMCSLMMPGEEFNRTLRSTIGKIDLDTGHYTETFLQLKGGARANASCVTYGYSLYIIGGLVEAENDPDHLIITNSIAKYDFFNDIFDPTWYNHTTAVMDAAVAKDSSGFYVSGGLEAEGGKLSLSRIIKAYYPDYDCRRELSTDTDNGVPAMIKSPDFAFVMWAQTLILVAPHRDVFYTRPFGIAGFADQKWATYNISEIPVSEPSLRRTQLSTLYFVPMLGADGANVTGASFVLFLFGGLERVTSDPVKPLVPVLRKSILKTVTNIRTPAPILGDQDVKQYLKWSLNVSGIGVYTGCEQSRACMVALAVSPTCESPHASDTDAVQWDPEKSVVDFMPRGTSPRVYLCFSYGNMDQTCERGPERVKPVEQVYYPTNLFSPFTVVLASTAPTHEPTNPPEPPSEISWSTILVASASGLLLAILALCLCRYWKKSTLSREKESLLLSQLGDVTGRYNMERTKNKVLVEDMTLSDPPINHDERDPSVTQGSESQRGTTNMTRSSAASTGVPTEVVTSGQRLTEKMDLGN